MTIQPPARELHAAAFKLRVLSEDDAPVDPELIGPIGDMLRHIANDMERNGAVEGSASKSVHPVTVLGLSEPREEWTAALAAARVINAR